MSQMVEIVTFSCKRVLCFGDSNTWGRSGASPDRYPEEKRWTFQLQQLLGIEYEIIEEGLRSRTTNIDDDDPAMPGRNGLTYLIPCVESHSPLDVVILWLGTNDLKTRFRRSAQDIAESLAQLVQVIHTRGINRSGQPPKILLVSPPLVREECLKPESQFLGAGEKSKQLATELQKLAESENIDFIDVAPLALPGEFDGVHLEPELHPIIAKALYERIKEICP